ncbi:methyltransferase [Conexibacter sp. SYSU D00693]|uniref:N5-glutamine methyltransferase family protein n=1 Tax=Conexibacter sp. SYSU D00693 TaxID=2812560 RepID=UPI00196AB32D|nr:methyltransferase [Conexibacter sp. SYSU D00693]
MPSDHAGLTALLASEGFVAADEEAAELLACAAGAQERLEDLVARRRTGEPLAWITGGVVFCGVEVRIDPGVYVPRWQTEHLAERAAQLLPEDGVAIDVCTGSGAIAKVLQDRRPRARVLATELHEAAVACARENGVEVVAGELLEPLPADLRGAVDVVVAVVPYVPTPDLPLLQRDTFAFETPLAYDGGADGTDLLRRVVVAAPRFLRRGGALLLELGAGQPALLAGDLARAGFAEVRVLRDEDGDVRGVEARLARTAMEE